MAVRVAPRLALMASVVRQSCWAERCGVPDQWVWIDNGRAIIAVRGGDSSRNQSGRMAHSTVSPQRARRWSQQLGPDSRDVTY